MKFGGRSPPFPDAELIRTLAALLTETGLTEIEYAIGDRRIRVSRASGGPASPPAVVASSTPPTRSASAEHPGAVKAPMVGTAYLAPEPGARPFVEVGTVVKTGESLMIIEAMKTMNQIPAPRPGTVIQILVDDGQPVESGQPLMIIE